VAGKIVELIRELLPDARRFAVLANETDVFTKGYLAENERIARSVGLEMVPVMVRPAGPLEAAFQTMTDRRAEAVVIQGSLVRQHAVEMATKHRLPSLGSSLFVPRSGGLMAYSADFAAYLRDAASYIDKILKGEKPADLPVSFPTKWVLAINLKTAKALGLTVPPTLLARADEVIE
jgi:putative ABC transport system substrate-binding protein